MSKMIGIKTVAVTLCGSVCGGVTLLNISRSSVPRGAFMNVTRRQVATTRLITSQSRWVGWPDARPAPYHLRQGRCGCGSHQDPVW